MMHKHTAEMMRRGRDKYQDIFGLTELQLILKNTEPMMYQNYFMLYQTGAQLGYREEKNYMEEVIHLEVFS